MGKSVSIPPLTETVHLISPLLFILLPSSRKFQLPGNTATLRWKRVGDHYQCSLCSLACTCHTPVATLQLSTPTTPGELSVFSAAANADPRQSQHSGVSIRLLEYLIITSVLLTTAHDDWRRFPNAPDFSSPPLSTRSLRQRLSSPPSSPTASCVSTNLASPTRRKLDLLEGDSEPFYCSSPTSTHTHSPYTTRSLTHSRSSNYLRPTALYSTPFSTPPSTPPIAYHELPTINPPVRPLPAAPAPAPAPAQAPLAVTAAPPVPSIPQHFLTTTPEEAPPSYAEIEWTVKVPQKHRVSRREQGSLLA